MSSNATCRFALHLGLSTMSYAKLEAQAGSWRLVSSGLVETPDLNASPEEARQGLVSILQQLVKQEGLGREPIHVSLHNRMCITRVLTGNRQQVDSQLAEITENSHHYLQLGLGEKLIGQSVVPIDESRQYGQVAIIKRGLIESVEAAVTQVGLEVASVDGALTCICRVTGLAGLDRSPLLLVWLGSSGAEIGISYKGRLQLNYHSGECTNLETTAQTIGKHLKRLRRFCDRYRQVDGKSDLRQVLVLTKNGEEDAFRQLLNQYDFERIFTIQDLRETALGDKLGPSGLFSAGATSALGGLLVHHEAQVLPTTDIYDKFVASKPQSWRSMIVSDGWPLLAAAALLAGVMCGRWALGLMVHNSHDHAAELANHAQVERQQLMELDQLRSVLREYQRLDAKAKQHSVRDIITRVAQCLPGECRLDWCGFDAQSELILKGTMLQGDQTYEILKALRNLPEISEVALESVGNSSNHGKTATLFEIHCALTGQAVNSAVAAQSPTRFTQLTASN